jgi:hypothetical protein
LSTELELAIEALPARKKELEHKALKGHIVTEDYDLVYLSNESAEMLCILFIKERDQHQRSAWRMARVAYEMVGRSRGRGAVKSFAAACSVGVDTIYNGARAWRTRLDIQQMIEDGKEGVAHPETLSFSHYVEGSYDPDPFEVLALAEDRGLSSGGVREKVKERKLERAKREIEAGEGRTPETIEATECPECGAHRDYWDRVPSTLKRPQ